LVFAQSEEVRLPLTTFVAHARTHGSLAILVRDETAAGDAATIYTSAEGEKAAFRLQSRRTTPADVAVAREAEQRGRAAGMGDLAARCPTVWQLESDAPEWLTLELCAVLAFAALGPVLPPDASTLLGVRSAREKAARLRQI